MSSKLVTPTEAIALQSFSRKVNGSKAFTDTFGEPCGPRAIVGQGEYHGRIVIGLDYGYSIGEAKPKPATIPWSKVAALLANRVNNETMRRVVALTLQGRFESVTQVKADLLSPLKAPVLKDGRLSVKYIDSFSIATSVSQEGQ